MENKRREIPQEIMEIINVHALGAAASGLGTAWLPGVGSVAAMTAMVGFIWSMYFQINKKLGVDMSRAKLKTLASAMMSNLAQSTLSVVGGIAVSSLLSMTGFGNVLSSVIMAGVDYAVVKVGGILYMKLISGLTGNGRDPGNMSDDELRICLKQVIECEDLQRMMSESKKEYAKGRKNGTITGHERVSTIEMER